MYGKCNLPNSSKHMCRRAKNSYLLRNRIRELLSHSPSQTFADPLNPFLKKFVWYKNKSFVSTEKLLWTNNLRDEVIWDEKNPFLWSRWRWWPEDNIKKNTPHHSRMWAIKNKLCKPKNRKFEFVSELKGCLTYLQIRINYDANDLYPLDTILRFLRLTKYFL